MKKLLCTFAFIFTTLFGHSQLYYIIDFDDSDYLDRVVMDSSDPGCLWQVGIPSKPVFDTAYSGTRALLTDSLNAVLPNDTSVFYLIHERHPLQVVHVFSLKFWYKMHGSTGSYGRIEVSPDEGTTWIDILKEDTTYDFTFPYPKPTLTGSTVGWEYFDVKMSDWASELYPYPVVITEDTVLFRFTYITDNNTGNWDGWMIDDIFVRDWFTGINDIHSNQTTIYPNPAKDRITIALKHGVFDRDARVDIYDLTGRLMERMNPDAGSNEMTISTARFPPGVYNVVIQQASGQRSSSRVVLTP